MSLILKTEAIILRSINFSETSKIVTFYTKESGRLSGIVKGARNPKNKYGAALEPMSIVQLVIYVKDSREVQTVSQCDLIKSFHNFSASASKLSVGMSLIEMVNIVVHEQEQNSALFGLLHDALRALDIAENNETNILFKFQINLAEILGFTIQTETCLHCGNRLSLKQVHPWFLFSLTQGAVFCGDCDADYRETFKLSKQALESLSRFTLLQKISESSSIEITTPISDEIERFLSKYYQVHVSGFRNLRSRMMFNDLK